MLCFVNLTYLFLLNLIRLFYNKNDPITKKNQHFQISKVILMKIKFDPRPCKNVKTRLNILFRKGSGYKDVKKNKI